MKKIFVTTSWDDGHKLDLKLAALLDKYGLKGTFYISRNYFGKESLEEDEIRRLSQKHEIGGHTLNHPDLTKISLADAKKEIEEGKMWLENIVGKKVETFCYPGGFYNEEVAALVKNAGFISARTVKKFEIKKPAERFLAGTTIHWYPFPFRKKDASRYLWRDLLRPIREGWGGLRNIGLPFSKYAGLEKMSRAVFDAALSRGDYFHLWGHSWEIEKYGLWSELEEFLKYISRRSDCLYVTNGELIKQRNGNLDKI